MPSQIENLRDEYECYVSYGCPQPIMYGDPQYLAVRHTFATFLPSPRDTSTSRAKQPLHMLILSIHKQEVASWHRCSTET
jgi:hypothetical protein